MITDCPLFFPVIHPVSEATALQSVATAVEAGADGVFLINQGLGVAGVLDLARRVVAERPGLPVGVNLLGMSPARAVVAAAEAGESKTRQSKAPRMTGDCTHETGAPPLALYLGRPGRPDPFEPMARRARAKRKRR